MHRAVILALAFHSLLCLGFAGLLVQALRGRRLQVVETGPEGADWNEPSMAAIFYLAAGLYLAYAEIYLYRVWTWSSL